MRIVSYNGQDIDFDDAAAQMDPALREIVEAELGDCTEQELIDAYAAAHLAVYGADEVRPGPLGDREVRRGGREAPACEVPPIPARAVRTPSPDRPRRPHRV